jgi:hypothetical protein
MEQDNGEQPSSLSSPPKPIIVRPIKHPTDLIGWLFVGCECPEPVIGSPIIDPADRIGWLFLKDQDNGERSLLLLPTKPAIVRPITHPTDLIGWLFLKDKDDGGRHRDFAFQPGIPVPDVLLRPLHGYHEYIGVYELAGCDYSCDEHGMLNVLPETEKFIVDVTMEQEEGKLGNEAVQEKRLKYAKKASIHFVSKGRGVSENKEDRARVKGTSDSTNVYPFLTV